MPLRAADRAPSLPPAPADIGLPPPSILIGLPGGRPLPEADARTTTVPVEAVSEKPPRAWQPPETHPEAFVELARFVPPPGQWAEIPDTSIGSVLLNREDAPMNGGITGSRSVVDAWGGAAYDGSRYWYFHGGGHGDYSGNEVYRFDLWMLRWEQLTRPNDLAANPANKSCPTILDRGVHGEEVDFPAPRSTHTYDGMEVVGGTLYVMGSVGYSYCGAPGVWAFDPETKDWGLVNDRPWKGFAKSDYDPVTGRLYVAGQNGIFHLDVGKGEWVTAAGNVGWMGEGVGEVDPERGLFFFLDHSALKVFDIDLQHFVDIVPRSVPKSIGGHCGMANRPGTGLVFWCGDERVFRLDPATGEFRDWRASAGPAPHGQTKVFSRWFYLADLDVFLGYPRANSNVWLFAPPEGGDGRQVPSFSPADAVANAGPGDVVTIPPGDYYESVLVAQDGITIRAERPGTVRFHYAAAEGKAAVLVKASDVTIENLSIEGVRVGSNGACIRFQESGRNLTVRNLDCAGSEMGILVNGARGTIIIEDSSFSDMGPSYNADLGHNIYVSGRPNDYAERVVVRNSSFRRIRNDGHFVKVRALETIIEGNLFDGSEGDYSRIIDLSQGGDATIRGNTILHGPSGNEEAMGLAMEIYITDDEGNLRFPEIPTTRIEVSGNTVEMARRGYLVRNRSHGTVFVEGNTVRGRLVDWAQIGKDVDLPVRVGENVRLDSDDPLSPAEREACRSPDIRAVLGICRR
ncbi:MAG TPA: right-handed parallel beta-helix repeat-containing protein [Alphaproteobacteria bacterium]|nr:right-handed parallel beta-helix repeat-containing protein [Alphaproteobacteria bacterium]